jgi:hypothetical protein
MDITKGARKIRDIFTGTGQSDKNGSMNPAVHIQARYLGRLRDTDN